MKDFSGRLTTVDAIREFALAGNAVLTIRSLETGTRFTYKIRKAESKKPTDTPTWFVSVLCGPDNTNDFRYAGIIKQLSLPTFKKALTFRLTKKSKVSVDAPSAKAFVWFFGRVFRALEMPKNAEVWHDGRCGRCGRELSVPESVERGFGPECARIIDQPSAPALFSFDGQSNFQYGAVHG